LASSKNYHAKDWPYKNTIAVLSRRYVRKAVRSNTQQRQKPGIVTFSMPCIAGRYLRIRNALYFYKALIFGYFLIKQKVKVPKYFEFG
jgi:hypothetical protein